MLTLEQLIKERNRHQRLKEAYTLIINELKEKEPEEQKIPPNNIDYLSKKYAKRGPNKRGGYKKPNAKCKKPWLDSETNHLLNCYKDKKDVDILLNGLNNRTMAAIYWRLFLMDKKAWYQAPTSWKLKYKEEYNERISKSA